MFARIMRSVWRNKQGSALVEASVVLPFFCVLVFGVFEFSFIFYQQHLISTGVQDAARYLARSSASTNPTLQNTTLQTSAKNLAVTGATNGVGGARVTGWAASDVAIGLAAIDNSAGTYNGGPTICIVTVSTNFNYQSLGFLGFLGFLPPVLHVQHSERAIQSC